MPKIAGFFNSSFYSASCESTSPTLENHQMCTFLRKLIGRPDRVPWRNATIVSLRLHAICGNREAIQELARRLAENNDREALKAIGEYYDATKDTQAATC